MTGNLYYLLLAAPVLVLCLALVVRHWLRMRLPGSLRRRFVAARESGRLFVLLAIVVPCLYLLAIGVILRFTGGSLLLREMRAMPMALMFAAMQMLSLARRPAGTQWKCSKCNYDLRGLPEYQPSERPMQHDAKCPECAEQWGWTGGSIKTDKAWSPKWIALGVLLIAPLLTYFASIPIGGLLWWGRTLTTLAPTPSLVEEVLTARGFTNDAWAELATRKTSEQDTTRIATALLSRPAGAYMNTDERAWLTRMLAAHALDPALVEPKLETLFTISATRLDAASGIILTFTPQPTHFGAFSELDVGVWANSGPSLHGQLSAFAVAGSGYTLYTKYTLGPYATATPTDPDRFRGIVTVALIPRTAARPPGAPPNTLMAEPTGLYRLEIPLDLVVEAGR